MKNRYLLTSAILFAVCISALAQKADPTIMVVNGEPVSRSEFVYIYDKNNAANLTDKKSKDDYVKMFINFKLKVADAKAQGIDTTASFRTELRRYRDQLAAQYLTSDSMQNALVAEAYSHLQKDLDISHIFIMVPRNASPADTLSAYNKAVEAKRQLANQSFDAVAKKYSDDKSVADNGGHIGWITGFGTIYPFEKAAYSLKVGQISDPVRSPIGYHIIKVNAERPSPGEVHVAHIVKIFNKDKTNTAQIKQTMDSIYNLLQNGADFVKLAAQYSDDQMSARNGGDLPAFGTGRMVPQFETQAFALQNPGDISKPFETPYGWHVLKLIAKQPLASFDELKPQIENRLKSDMRADMPKQAFIDKLIHKYQPEMYFEHLEDYYPLIDTTKIGRDITLDSTFFKKAFLLPDKPLIYLAGKTFTEKDFTAYMQSNYATNKMSPQDIIDDKARGFLAQLLINRESDQLPYENPDFRNLVREYHDGILLFDVSDKEVWSRATTDTLGQENFFNANRTKYVWEKPRFKGTIVYCANEQAYNAAKEIVKKAGKAPFEKTLIDKLNNDSVQNVKFQRGLFAQGENKDVDKQIFKVNNDTVKSNFDPKFPYVLVVGKNIGKKPQNYTDVRGQLTTDYQDYLEKNWLDSLHKKYPVAIDQIVLDSVKEN